MENILDIGFFLVSVFLCKSQYTAGDGWEAVPADKPFFPGNSTGTGTPIHLTIQNSSSLLKAGEFGTHHLYVTKQKDTELRSSAAANAMNSADPIVDFAKFFDSESLLQEDMCVNCIYLLKKKLKKM